MTMRPSPCSLEHPLLQAPYACQTCCCLSLCRPVSSPYQRRRGKGRWRRLPPSPLPLCSGGRWGGRTHVGRLRRSVRAAEGDEEWRDRDGCTADPRRQWRLPAVPAPTRVGSRRPAPSRGHWSRSAANLRSAPRDQSVALRWPLPGKNSATLLCFHRMFGMRMKSADPQPERITTGRAQHARAGCGGHRANDRDQQHFLQRKKAASFVTRLSTLLFFRGGWGPVPACITWPRGRCALGPPRHSRRRVARCRARPAALLLPRSGIPSARLHGRGRMRGSAAAAAAGAPAACRRRLPLPPAVGWRR